MSEQTGLAAGLAAILRASCDADIAAITAIYGFHVLTGTASFETEAPDVAEMARRRTELVGRGYPYLVAEDGAGVAGYAYAGPYRARPAYRETVENSIYLRRDAVGRGLGRRLLGALIEACVERGFRQMVAVVGDSGNHASIRLHERAGFRMVGVLRSVGYKHGRWLDTVLLQRALGVGDTEPPPVR
ncbi:MAG TPA: GNAT family N-acetyltransferase [Acetobacteraceae bacterium]|nr:GNAT family N-acetyltransferase [Acetobacteraceae bacterium]